MRPGRGLAFDLHEGQLTLGSLRWAARSVGPAGAVEIGVNGPVLRPLTFGERSTLVMRASTSGQPAEALVAAVLDAAMLRNADNARAAPAADTAIVGVAALVLAGAAIKAPGFTEAALLVGRAGNWALMDILNAPASVVDQLALALASEADEVDDGWRRIVLVDTPPDDVSILCMELAERLLERGEPSNRRDGSQFVAEPAATNMPAAAVPSTLARPSQGPRNPARGNAPMVGPRQSRSGGDAKQVSPFSDHAPGPKSGATVARPSRQTASWALPMLAKGATLPVRPAIERARVTAQPLTAPSDHLAETLTLPGASRLTLTPMPLAEAQPEAAHRAAGSADTGGPMARRGAVSDHPQVTVAHASPAAVHLYSTPGNTNHHAPTRRESRAAPDVMPDLSPAEWADEIAILLADEADLRGVAR